jgi:diacylglycerol kinase (ATP)
MQERNILFIINPKAGRGNSENIAGIIKRDFPKDLKHEILVWRDRDHFSEIITSLRSGKFTDAVAVGGDGTVNQVAAAILNTDVTLGIIPAGSGNGLARSLGIPMETDLAIRQIVNGFTEKIDSGSINNIPFFCTSGIGFDAHIGNLFAASVKRGLKSYISITSRELLRYRAKKYILRFNGQRIERSAFLITVANAGQYGNDFYIAPQASMQDGLFHVVILKPFNALKVLPILRKILYRKAHLSSSVETYTTNHLIIERSAAEVVHYDGEPAREGNILEFRLSRASLKVIVGTSYAQMMTRHK